VLGLRQLPPGDAADALALAVTHLRMGPLAQAARPRPKARARGQAGAKAALAVLLERGTRVRSSVRRFG
jgi:hypothetical protein